MKLYLILIFLLVITFNLGNVSSEDNFEVSSLIIKSVVKEGESVVNPISIINHGKKQRFELDYSSEVDFISVKNKVSFLDKEESGTFEVIFDSKEYEAGVYIGELVISGESNSLRIPVILEIETHSLKFDVSSETAFKLPKLSPGDELEMKIKIYNLGSESGDVSLHYKIKNINGHKIISESQELSVNNQAEITKTFLIPKDAELGSYVFSVSAIDENSGFVGTSSSLFSLSEKILKSPKDKNFDYYLSFSLILIVILIISFLIINYYWNKRVKVEAKEWEKKLVDVKKIKFSNISKEIRKLEYQKRLLDDAFKRNYITKLSYTEGKNKLNALISKLKKRL